MYTLGGLIGLIAYIIIRPFDFMPGLRAVPFLYIFFGLALLGFVADFAQGNIRWRAGPHLPWAIGLMFWCVVTILLRAPGTLSGAYMGLLIPFSLYFLIAHGISDFNAFSRFVGVFLACTIIVSAACVYQGTRPLQCVSFGPEDDPKESDGAPDGRPCGDIHDCFDETFQDPDITYACERVGPAGITSIAEGRVRYAGVLHDPNEASMVVSLGIPLALARFQRRRSASRLAVLVLTTVLAVTTVFMSQSRGGIIVCLVVLGIYLLTRYRWKGILLAAMVGAPVLLLGGGNREDAEESKEARLVCQMEGIKMFKSYPLIGVGHGQFTEYHPQTAHNSFVLAPAELGIVGMTAWAMMLWVSIKGTRAGVKGSSGTTDSHTRTWGVALFAVLCGLAAGILFLTFNYHYLLWTVFGIAGAYYKCASEHDAAVKLRIGIKDVALVALANLALLAVLYVYIRSQGVS